MKSIAFIVVGGAAGYAWYRLVGCTGGCMLWSNPFLSALAGGFFGWTWSGGLKAKA